MYTCTVWIPQARTLPYSSFKAGTTTVFLTAEPVGARGRRLLRPPGQGLPQPALRPPRGLGRRRGREEPHLCQLQPADAREVPGPEDEAASGGGGGIGAGRAAALLPDADGSSAFCLQR